MFTLEHKGKRVDLSSTVSSTIIIILSYNGQYINTPTNSNEKLANFKVRFSGIPNNGTLELVELSQEEIGKEEKVKRIQGYVFLGPRGPLGMEHLR